MKSVELFLALGLATAIGVTSTVSVNANDYEVSSDEPVDANSYLLAEGGEGSEGGEGGEDAAGHESHEGGEGGATLSPGEQANADFLDKTSSSELLSELQQGGYVIYFRHAQTEKDYADQVTADVNNCSTQRVLSEVGWEQANMIGEAFEAAAIPIGKVTTSEYCRAWKTAGLAFGQYEKNPALNFLPFEDYTDEQVEQMKANVTPLLTAVPESGTNDIIVGHDDIFESATGIYPAPQGMAYVVKPDGNGGFELIANMLPEEWAEL